MKTIIQALANHAQDCAQLVQTLSILVNHALNQTMVNQHLYLEKENADAQLDKSLLRVLILITTPMTLLVKEKIRRRMTAMDQPYH